MNYWRRYGGDYLGDTLQLSMAEDGAYGRLLDYYYTRESVIPPVMGSVYRVVRAMTPEEQAAVRLVLEQHFELRDDGWHNMRADKELAIARQARENGSKSGGRPLRKITGGVTGGVTEQQTGEITESVTEKQTGTGHPLNRLTASLQPLKEGVNQKARNGFALPSWVPEPQWKAFEDSRRKARKAMTERAKELIVLELGKLKAAGYEPGAVLDQSLRKGWLDVFPIHGAAGGREEANRAALEEAKRGLFGGKLIAEAEAREGKT